MEFQAYLGVLCFILGFVLLTVEVTRKQFAEALHSVSLCVIGVLLLTRNQLEPGWTSRAVVVGAFLIGVSSSLAARRLSRRQRS